MGGEDEESFGVFRLCNKLDIMGDRKSIDRLIQITSQPLKGIDEFLLLFLIFLLPNQSFSLMNLTCIKETKSKAIDITTDRAAA